jgi:RNA-directed DNA polymerase
VQGQMEALGLRLHPTKTRVVNDRKEGFDFLGFHHHRVELRKKRTESWGVLRWPSRKTCRRFRERVRQHLGTPGHTRQEWNKVCGKVRAYMAGWIHYYRHGESAHVFRELDEWVRERVARHMARSQPTGRKRKRRTWGGFAEQLKADPKLPRLTELRHAEPRAYRGQANARWRAVSGRT